jgi:hypothetical protein
MPWLGQEQQLSIFHWLLFQIYCALWVYFPTHLRNQQPDQLNYVPPKTEIPWSLPWHGARVTVTFIHHAGMP